jgi:hypothetical protein
MKILVCVKQAPDTAAERTLRPVDGVQDRDLFKVVPPLLAEIGKRAAR